MGRAASPSLDLDQHRPAGQPGLCLQGLDPAARPPLVQFEGFEGLALLWAVSPQGTDWRSQAEASMRHLLAGLRVPHA